MENQFLMLPANRQQDPLVDFIDAEDAVIIDEAPVQTKAYVNFLEANTNAITMEELSNTCVVPTWGNQELTISHQDFIHTVHDAATSFFSGETVNAPDIRVSHIVRGRIPSALHKKASELLESEKTQFYQRLALPSPSQPSTRPSTVNALNSVLEVSVTTLTLTYIVRARVLRSSLCSLVGASTFAAIKSSQDKE